MVGKVYQRGVVETETKDGLTAPVELTAEQDAELRASMGDPLSDVVPRR